MKWIIFTLLCAAIVICTQDAEILAIQLSLDMMGSRESSIPIEDVFMDLKDKMTNLYYLCRNDFVCSNRFYIEIDATQGNDFARKLQIADEANQMKKFFRVLVFWAQQDDSPLSANYLRDRITLSDYTRADQTWWLTMMNTAKICNDNQMWEVGQGCIVRFDRLNDAGNPIKPRTKIATSNQSVEFLTVMVISLLIISVIVSSLLVIRKNFFELKKSIDTLIQMSRGIAPPRTMPVNSQIQSDANADTIHSDVNHSHLAFSLRGKR